MTCRCVAPVDITVYREPGSAEGRELLLYLERKGVRLEDVDVSADSNARQQMLALSGQAERPIVVVDGQVFIGFDSQTLDTLVPSRF